MSLIQKTGDPITELPSYLKRWMTLQEEIVALNTEVKSRRTQAKALQDVILRIMEQSKVAVLETQKGTVVHKTRETAEKISNEYLLKHCKTFFGGNEERAQELVKFLEDNRTVIQKHDLKIQINRNDEGSQKS